MPNSVSKGSPCIKRRQSYRARMHAYEKLFGGIQDYVSLSPQIYGDLEDVFLVTAQSNGMRNAGILDGDILIFKVAEEARDGDIIAGMINGEVRCRRIFHEGTAFRFRREDGETPDIITSDCTIYGILVGLMRRNRKG